MQNKINKYCYTIIIRTYFRHYLLVKIWSMITTGISTGGGEDGGGQGGHPSNWISEPNRVQQFQFQTSGMLLFMGVQTLYGPEILSMLQFLGNFRTSFHFFYLHKGSTSLHVASSGKVQYLTLDLLKSFSLRTIRKKTTMDEYLNVGLYTESWTYWKSPLK